MPKKTRKQTLRRRHRQRKQRKSRRRHRGGRAPIVNNSGNQYNNVALQVPAQPVFDANEFAEYLGEKIQYLLDNQVSQVNAGEREEMINEIVAVFTSMPLGEQEIFNEDALVIPDDLDFSSQASVQNIYSKLYSFMAGH